MLVQQFLLLMFQYNMNQQQDQKLYQNLILLSITTVDYGQYVQKILPVDCIRSQKAILSLNLRLPEKHS
ncbi:hypothetical protein SDC9_144097 [bioreactor metagenome]|uniref:Uncharacterized protein n=1 Tax=bioreactor metagenome TaxID=1076179 RepID=A0A645E598_9ZZZZ